ncbi:MAG TPA: hypothetical protein VK927_05650, partial [Adhaeribacter sp.]|nr:hypothetical protein [Adhaeribacter sp.]
MKQLPSNSGLKNRIAVLLAAILFFSAPALQAQSRHADTLMHIPMVYAGGGYDLAGGDMAKRFGNNYEVGAGFLFKTRNNWL